jgi:hypothetical protein
METIVNTNGIVDGTVDGQVEFHQLQFYQECRCLSSEKPMACITRGIRFTDGLYQLFG